MGPVSTIATYGLLVLLAVLLAVWGAFLVPFRVGGTLVPVSWAVAVGGNLLLGRYGGRALGRRGAGAAGLVWAAVAVTLGTQRGEGDLVVPGTVPGLGFLLAGAVTSAVAYAATPRGALGRGPEGGDR